MSRTRTHAPKRASREAEHLVTWTRALNASGSRIEDRYWERQLEESLGKLLRTGQDAPIETALDDLVASDPSSSEVLLELCETLSESMVIEKDGQRFDVLLIVAPLAVWTRYTIPAGKIKDETLHALQAQLHGHVLAGNAQLALMPMLLSVDQMPLSFSATQHWTQRLGLQALGKPTTQKLTLPTDEEVANMLADARYLVGAVAVPEGEAIFRWQETPEVSRQACHAEWAAQAEPSFASLLPGCGIEILLPDAWYVGNREADRGVRPLSIRAAVGWLATALDAMPADLRAVVAACGENEITEYRIGFTQRNSNEVLYGCIWPVFGPEDLVDDAAGPEVLTTPEQIVSLLRAEGVVDIRRLPGVMMPEFCDDCGAPYFPDPTGELVHAEMPEDTDITPGHFH